MLLDAFYPLRQLRDLDLVEPLIDSIDLTRQIAFHPLLIDLQPLQPEIDLLNFLHDAIFQSPHVVENRAKGDVLVVHSARIVAWGIVAGHSRIRENPQAFRPED